MVDELSLHTLKLIKHIIIRLISWVLRPSKAIQRVRVTSNSLESDHYSIIVPLDLESTIFQHVLSLKKKLGDFISLTTWTTKTRLRQICLVVSCGEYIWVIYLLIRAFLKHSLSDLAKINFKLEYKFEYYGILIRSWYYIFCW